MAEFPVNPQRPDPYKNFRFRVKWDGMDVAGINEVAGLNRTTEFVENRAAGEPATAHKTPGRNKFEAITLERGVTYDMQFHDWCGLVWSFGELLEAELLLANRWKDLSLEEYNEAGQLVIAYNIHRCWVSEYQALPDLDADADAVAIEHIKLENEGWERDTSVKEQPDPTLGS
jgi:phage tail-like protein